MTTLNHQTVDALNYLQAHGMTEAQLGALHHDQLRPGTFKLSREYFARGMAMGDKNTLYAKRLIFVSEQHANQQGMAALVEKALIEFPKT